MFLVLLSLFLALTRSLEFGFFLKAHDNKCFSEYIKNDVYIAGELNSQDQNYVIHLFDPKGKLFY